MDFGLSNVFNTSTLASLYRTGMSGKKGQGISFLELASATAASSASASQNVTGMSLEEMWKSRYPGAYYHVMDGSKISQEAWDRNDFPFERFFSDDVDPSILDWKPTGAEPAANDPQVQSRWGSVAGQKAIIVPPALEEKMKNDPKLAEKVMANIDNFIATYPAEPGCSYLIELDENGDIAKYRVTGPVRIGVSSSEFADANKARRAKQAEYNRIAEENALRRRLQEQEEIARALQHKIISMSGHEELSAPRLTTVPTEATPFAPSITLNA